MHACVGFDGGRFATHSMKVLSRIHCQLCSGVIKDSLIIFIRLLMTTPSSPAAVSDTACTVYYYNIYLRTYFFFPARLETANHDHGSFIRLIIKNVIEYV